MSPPPGGGGSRPPLLGMAGGGGLPIKDPSERVSRQPLRSGTGAHEQELSAGNNNKQ